MVAGRRCAGVLREEAPRRPSYTGTVNHLSRISAAAAAAADPPGPGGFRLGRRARRGEAADVAATAPRTGTGLPSGVAAVSNRKRTRPVRDAGAEQVAKSAECGHCGSRTVKRKWLKLRQVWEFSVIHHGECPVRRGAVSPHTVARAAVNAAASTSSTCRMAAATAGWSAGAGKDPAAPCLAGAAGAARGRGIVLHACDSVRRSAAVWARPVRADPAGARGVLRLGPRAGDRLAAPTRAGTVRNGRCYIAFIDKAAKPMVLVQPHDELPLLLQVLVTEFKKRVRSDD